MKSIFCFFIVLLLARTTDAQLIKKIIDRTKQKTEDKISEKVSEKASNAATKPIDNVGNGNKNKNQSGENTATGKSGSGEEKPATATVGQDGINTKNGDAALSTYSKFDFVPGEKVLVEEDFSQDAVGDFPDKWNTNSSGEIVTAEGQQGHWLMIKKQGRFVPEFLTVLPENFTMQFDLMVNEKFSFYSQSLSLYFITGDRNKGIFDYAFMEAQKRSGVKVDFHPTDAGNKNGIGRIQTFEDGASIIKNEVSINQFSAFGGRTKIKVSIWRQKQRIRVYVNEEKIFDLPRAFAANQDYGIAMFEIWSGMANEADRYLVGNIRLAAGAPDTRNKLITEGKFSTTGILFDVNSDKIKPESYGVLKDIAGVLNDNPGVKIRIVGHTDSDGDDNSNLELSKKRAASVKTALENEFKISGDRMVTDGMGEKQPVADNKTTEGKANNRRVEFIKI